MNAKQLLDERIAGHEAAIEVAKAELAELKKPVEIKMGDRVIANNSGEDRVALYDKNGDIRAYAKNGHIQGDLEKYSGKYIRTGATIFDDMDLEAEEEFRLNSDLGGCIRCVSNCDGRMGIRVNSDSWWIKQDEFAAIITGMRKVLKDAKEQQNAAK